MAQNSGKFIAYYRVSTGRQGKSGLGLEAQREAVKTYLNGGDWQIVELIEAGMISARTKAALAAAKRRGVKLGGNRSVKPSAKMQRASKAALQARADARAADIAPTIKALQEAGATSLRAIADGLNAKKIPTSRGNGEWSAVQVARVLERLDPFASAAVAA